MFELDPGIIDTSILFEYYFDNNVIPRLYMCTKFTKVLFEYNFPHSGSMFLLRFDLGI